ncbi:MAG: N-acetyl-gamma-glutamyl-phosphate reductase [Puniceicoccales bacterium]|jgi:N-acetyl-gamma-glutamyl-phosphate reductase|nr:N-acetyl-gamma-glutamyl-phosphate reductase [Puniceicoccales bacterium]
MQPAAPTTAQATTRETACATAKPKVGIVGASGYTGEELVRLLARHPFVTLSHAASRSLAGTSLRKAFPQCRETLPPELAFVGADPESLAREDVAFWFLALPHGVAATYARAFVSAGRRVLDLSADFRLGSPALYKEYYEAEHPAPDLLAAAPYVLPELATDDAWKSAPLIACPGCYPTSIQIALTPLLRAGLLKPAPGATVINSYSGVSGAGKKADILYLYCERDESVKAYGIPRHRHLSEIEEQLSAAAGAPVVVQFNPHLAPMKRGISTTITVPARGVSVEQVYRVWEAAYAGKPFVGILPSGTYPETGYVSGTNRADISAVSDPRTGNLVLTSAIDNLMKGAGGQAVQIMNLLADFPETAGLV